MNTVSLEKFSELNLEEMKVVKNNHIEKQLEKIVNLIYKTSSFSTALDLKKIYDELSAHYDGERQEFYDSLYPMITNYVFSVKWKPITEKDIHSWFENEFHRIVSDGKILHHEHHLSKGEYRADYLCEVYGLKTIVEIKKGVIGKNALKQIKNYMKLSKSKFGILVGKELEITLPKNIMFISYVDGSFA